MYVLEERECEKEGFLLQQQRIWLNEDKCLWTISNKKIRSLTRLV